MSRVPGIVGRMIARQRPPASVPAESTDPFPEPDSGPSAEQSARELLRDEASLSYNELLVRARPVLGAAMPSPRPRAAIMAALEALAARDQ